MTSMVILSIIVLSLFTLSIINKIPVYATTAASDEQPKPGIIMIITFENGTTKAIRSDSTNMQAVNGGYFIADSSVKESQPLQSKAVSKTVVQQLVSVFVDVSIVDEPPTSSEGCGKGYGYYVDDPNPICEPLNKIGQGPPPDQAFCAALGCPYNPPTETELPGENNNNNDFATTPVTPTETPPTEPQPEPDLGPDSGDGDQQQEENQNENSDGGDGDSSTEGDGDNSDEEESEE